MSDQENERSPKAQSAPPRPRHLPKTAHALDKPAGKPGTAVYILDSMAVKDLASALGLKPFQVISDLMQLKLFKSPDDPVDFATAAAVAQKHGLRAERPPPGMLIL